MKHSINTAPKDGTFILLFGGDAGDGDEVSHLYSSEELEAAINARPVVGAWIEGHWVYAAWDSDWRSVYSDPTHWMEIPK